MRRRTISDEKEILEIISKSSWCHVAMTDLQGEPYVIPMNFGIRDNVIYLHGARKGKKIDILRSHPSVCINFSTDHLLRAQSEEIACSWSMVCAARQSSSAMVRSVSTSMITKLSQPMLRRETWLAGNASPAQ